MGWRSLRLDLRLAHFVLESADHFFETSCAWPRAPWHVFTISQRPRSAQRPEIKAFCAWLQVQAEATRQAIGDVPDPDLNDNLD